MRESLSRLESEVASIRSQIPTVAEVKAAVMSELDAEEVEPLAGEIKVTELKAAVPQTPAEAPKRKPNLFHRLVLGQ
jgi:hypothetical protein